MSEIENPPPHRGVPWLKISLIFIVLLAAGGGIWLWLNRPIQPVVLSPSELALVEEKVAAIQHSSSVAVPAPAPSAQGEPVYERGKKEIVLTEREINGLLNANTDLGKSLSFQLGTDAVLARVETDIDPDLPVLGGRRFKARARFLVNEAAGHPSFVIDDVTIWGVSLPNAWLGGLKGRNLLADLLGGEMPGVESFAIRPGELSIKLAE